MELQLGAGEVEVGAKQLQLILRFKLSKFNQMVLFCALGGNLLASFHVIERPWHKIICAGLVVRTSPEALMVILQEKYERCRFWPLSDVLLSWAFSGPCVQKLAHLSKKSRPKNVWCLSPLGAKRGEKKGGGSKKRGKLREKRSKLVWE